MTSISEKLADAAAKAGQPPRAVIENLLIDVAGLCVAARNTDYVQAALNAWEASGNCTAIGHARGLDSAGAAFVNGTAAHGEDFDDTSKVDRCMPARWWCRPCWRRPSMRDCGDRRRWWALRSGRR